MKFLTNHRLAAPEETKKRTQVQSFLSHLIIFYFINGLLITVVKNQFSFRQLFILTVVQMLVDTFITTVR